MRIETGAFARGSVSQAASPASLGSRLRCTQPRRGNWTQSKKATQSAAAAVARYKGGVGSLLDMITAQSDETQSRVLLIQSYLDWYTALARLNFAVGAADPVLKAGTGK